MIKEIINYGNAEIAYKQIKALSKAPILYNLFWETTLKCNAKCKHCGSHAGEDYPIKDELTTEEIKNALQQIANKYDATKILLNITGGEPLLRKDLFDVMNFAKNLGYRWGMTTNGILINDAIIEIEDCNMADYFILSYYVMKNGQEKYDGILTPTGRGSAVGMYINKLLRLTKVDKVNSSVEMYPERFLTKERVLESHTPPD